MSSMVVDNAPATVKGKPRHPIRPRSSYRTMKRRQPFGGFSDRNAYFSDDVVAASQQVTTNGKQRSDKSIYEKTLQMLMKAGQAAFDLQSGLSSGRRRRSRGGRPASPAPAPPIGG